MVQTQSKWPQIKVRLHPEVKKWLESKRGRNGSSLNNEIFRCLRDRMEAEKGLEALKNEAKAA